MLGYKGKTRSSKASAQGPLAPTLMLALALGMFSPLSGIAFLLPRAEASAKPENAPLAWTQEAVRLEAALTHQKRWIQKLKLSALQEKEKRLQMIEAQGHLASLLERKKFFVENLRINPSPLAQEMAKNLAPQKEKKMGRSLASVKIPAEEANKVELEKNLFQNLLSAFPEAHKLSYNDWESIGKIFGTRLRDFYLLKNYPFETVEHTTAHRGPASVGTKKPIEEVLVFVEAPFAKIARASKHPALKGKKFGSTFAAKNAKRFGFVATTLELSAYTSLEDQADDLQTQLRLLKSQYPDKKFLLVSSGEASALVKKYFEQNPAQRYSTDISAWVNVDGRLSGPEDISKTSARAPASVEPSTETGRQRVNNYDAMALEQLQELRYEAAARPMGVGKGFPVYNYVHWEKEFRPVENLRESLLDGAANFRSTEQPNEAAFYDFLRSKVVSAR